MNIGEILRAAGIDTLLGMGTVFLILILISIIIWLLGVMTHTERKGAPPVETAAPTPAPSEPGEDTVLAAVIMAAIKAYQDEHNGSETDDTYVVRSIRRATWKHTQSE